MKRKKNEIKSFLFPSWNRWVTPHCKLLTLTLLPYVLCPGKSHMVLLFSVSLFQSQKTCFHAFFPSSTDLYLLFSLCVTLCSSSPFDWCYDIVGKESYLESNMGSPGESHGKEPAGQRRRPKRHRFNSWVGKIPGRWAWQSTPVFLPGESQGQRAWGATAHSITRSRTE